MKRKLASIQIISNIEPIEDADRIDKATVMGWDVVVIKGEFSIGDKCIFCEVDSVLPDGEAWAEFMRPRKFRIKTARLRGVLSQGIAFPLNILPESENLEVGTDVTEALGIKKYEIPVGYGGAKMGTALGSFPARVPKTDEIRLQSALEVIDEIKKGPFYITVKCDGTSGTFVYDDEGFSASSRNWKKKDDDTNIYWEVAKKHNLMEKLAAHPFFAVQGEICGPGIQANKLMLKEISLFVFSVFDIKGGKYLDYKDFLLFCADLKLDTVPIEQVVWDEELEHFDYSLDAWLEMAKGTYYGTERSREGIVIRPLVETYSPTLRGRLSFKIINNEYLLKEEVE